MSRDTDQLARTLGGMNVRAYRQFFPAAAAKEAPRQVSNGVKMNSDGRVTIQGQTYSRAEFRAALEANIKAQREDPKSAYRNASEPTHKQAVEEINLAYRWLGGELTESDEREVIQEWHEATQEDSQVSNPEPVQQIAEMMRDPEVRAAKQRRDAGARLDDREKEIMRQYDQLETANNIQARKEAAGAGGTFKTTRPHYVAPDLYRIEAIKDPRERVHAIRALRSQWRDDPKHPYNDVNHADHKSAVENMSRLYQEESNLGKQPEDRE